MEQHRAVSDPKGTLGQEQQHISGKGQVWGSVRTWPCGGTAREKTPGNSEGDGLRQTASHRMGASRGDHLCCLGQLPKEGCLLSKVKLGLRIEQS